MTSSSAWEVLVVRHGTLLTTRGAMFQHPDDPGAAQRIDYYFWVLRSRDETLLIDTGSSADAMRERGRTVTVAPSRVLGALGIGAEWAGTVVLTHAHWDHTGHLAELRSARVVMARSEFDFWHSPESEEPAVRALADERDLEVIDRVSAEGRLSLVAPGADGYELRPGVRLLPAPGHTPGQLMVEVDTAVGPVLVTSDAVHFDEELARRTPFRHMVDVVSAHRSYDAIADRQEAPDGGRRAIVVPGHEPGLLDHYPRADGDLGLHTAVIGRLTEPMA